MELLFQSSGEGIYLQVGKEARQIKASLLRIPVLVGADILKTGVGEHAVVIL